MIASTAVPPTVTVMDVSPSFVGSGKESALAVELGPYRLAKYNEHGTFCDVRIGQAFERVAGGIDRPAGNHGRLRVG